MIQQTSIHLKVNNGLKEALDKYCDTTWKSRNRVINEAIRDYLNLKQSPIL